MKRLLIIPCVFSIFMIIASLTPIKDSKVDNVTSIKTDKVSDITQVSVKCFFTIAGNNMAKAGVCLNLTGSPTTPSKIDIPLSEHLKKEINKEKPDLIVLFTKPNRKWFDRLFPSSEAQEMAFNTKIPLLVFRKKITA